jgi:DNA-binding GntR family transcriptional regulator
MAGTLKGDGEQTGLTALGAQGLPLLSDGEGLMSREASLAQAQNIIRSIMASRHDRPSLVAQITCEIGAEIVEAIIPPGHDLNTVELARRYRTSRTPVREALILLENEGLVDIPPRKRPRAHSHMIAEVREIYRTRTVLFELMATDVATRVTEQDIDLLRCITKRMERACNLNDVIAFAWLSVEFHDQDTRLSGNSTAKRIHDSLLLRTLSIRRLSLSQPGRLERSLDNHIQLVKAYETHDPHMASAILRANHTGALAAVEKYYEQTGLLKLAGPSKIVKATSGPAAAPKSRRHSAKLLAGPCQSL